MNAPSPSFAPPHKQPLRKAIQLFSSFCFIHPSNSGPFRPVRSPTELMGVFSASAWSSMQRPTFFTVFRLDVHVKCRVLGSAGYLPPQSIGVGGGCRWASERGEPIALMGRKMLHPSLDSGTEERLLFRSRFEFSTPESMPRRRQPPGHEGRPRCTRCTGGPMGMGGLWVL